MERIRLNGTISVRGSIDGSLSIPKETGGSIPKGGSTGDLLAKRSDADYSVEWITPANDAEEDNTRPITAGAVYREIGNIDAILQTI